MFFLTQIDPRAAIKGSRDPLGFQPIWSRFGRNVIGNLTTVTTSVRNFTTLLLGLYFADQAVGLNSPDSEKMRAGYFLKFEQLAAYSRYAYNSNGNKTIESIRGLRRIQRRFAEGSGVVRISASSDHQILSNQKTYGIWGLYSVAARRSGMIEQQEYRLTPKALDFVTSEYLPRLSYNGSKDGADIVRFLKRDATFEPRHKDKRLGRVLAAALGPELTKAERRYYESALVLAREDGRDYTSGAQQQLWQIIREINNSGRLNWNTEFNFIELTETIKVSIEKGLDALTAHLYSIHTLEPMLAASGSLFGFLQMRNEAPLVYVANEVRAAWGSKLRHIAPENVEHIRPRIAEATSPEATERIVSLAKSLHVGDYLSAIRILIEQNAEVMNNRGGAPWISIERNKLKVRLREEPGLLPQAAELPFLWINSYFINSLKSIGRTVEGIQH